MKLSSLYKLKGSSIIESVIAMTVIAICLSIAIVVYSRVLTSDNNTAFYMGQQKVKELLLEVEETNSFLDEDFDFETYKIQKRVEKVEESTAHKIVFTVITSSQRKTYQYIVNN